MLTRLARSLRRSNKPRKSAAPIVTAALESLENRQMLAVSPVVAGSKIKGINLSSGGVSTNQTLVTIPFSADVTLVDATKLRMFAYAINPLSSKLGQVKKTINILNPSILALDVNGDGKVDHQLLQFTTDRLARKGASIVLNEGALQDANGDTLATQTVKTVKGQNRERFTLANRAFVPTDLSLFTPDIFTNAPTPADASTAPADATVTAALQAFLDKKVAAGTITQAQETAAMTRYADPATVGTIPPANLRAALFSLTGTFAEGAIGSILDGKNVTGKPYTIVTFQNPTDPTVPAAQTSARPSDGRLRTVFKPQFAGESFVTLSAFIAHEALHQDNNYTMPEEDFANTAEVLVTIQQAQTDFSFMRTGTALSNYNNDEVLAFLNSGRTIFPYVGLLQAPMLNGANGVFQGNTVNPSDGHGKYLSFDDYIDRIYKARGSVDTPSPGNALLNVYYNAFTGKALAANATFSDGLITDLDSFQAIAGTHASIVAAQALHLALS